MKQFIKSSISISLKNWPALLAFDIVYKIFCFSVLYSITSGLLSLILETAGISYLSAENLFSVFRNPLSVLLCLCFIFTAIFFVFFETTALYVYCEAGWQQRRISIAGLLRQTILHCRKLLQIQNTLLFFGFMLTTVLTVLPFSPYALRWIHVPVFIMDFIKQNTLAFVAFIFFSILAAFICLLFLFCFPNTLFRDLSIKAAWKDGCQLLKKRKRKTLFRLFVVFFTLGIGITIIASAAIISLVYHTKLTEIPFKAVDTFTIYFYRAIPVAVFMINFLASISLFAVFTTLYHEYNGDKRPSGSMQQDKAGWLYWLKQAVLLAFAVIAVILFSESELGGSFMHQTYALPKVIGHRSVAAFAPENTMAALDNAISMGIDMVEIDVQQLKDGSLVLLHDDNFKRTTGHNKKVWEVGYDEAQTYDAGSWFSPQFTGEPIPALEDILKRAKGNIQVMIELKFTGRETNLVRDVIELIEKSDMVDQCSIGSLNLELLKEVNAINPQIEIVYITPLIYSNQYNIDFVDAFSVETTVLTKEMVTIVHSQEKEIYGWTANSIETIQKNLQCGVDGIITDNPKLVEQYAMQKWDSRLLNTVCQIFFDENVK